MKANDQVCNQIEKLSLLLLLTSVYKLHRVFITAKTRKHIVLFIGQASQCAGLIRTKISDLEGVVITIQTKAQICHCWPMRSSVYQV